MTVSTSPEVLVDGRWLTGILPWGDMTITHRWPYGCWEASWSIATNEYRRLDALTARKPVEIRFGPTPLFTGYMAEPDWDTGRMIAVGDVRRGEEALCFDAALNTTSVPTVAIDQAIARGAVNWTRGAGFSAVAFGEADQTAQLNYLTALLDASTTQAGTKWGVNAYRVAYAAADPTTPDWLVTPGAGVLGVADSSLAARLFVRHLSSATGRYETVSIGSGAPEVGVGLARLGAMDATKATQIGTGIRDQLQARTGWTNGLLLTPDQVTGPGGTALQSFSQVRAGQMIRLLGLRDERGAAASTDIVLAETIWNVADETLQANPVGLEARDMASIIEDAGGELL